MKTLRTMMRWLCWMVFAIWAFLTLVKSLLWSSFVFTAAWGPAGLMLLALLINAVPLPLFLWINRSAERHRHAFAGLAIGLLSLLLSEGLVELAAESDFLLMILWQAPVLAAMFTLTAFHQNETFALE